jgi:acyl-CoA reductase-like NAD-dependent aldehyde dehydrogenase
MQTKLFIDGELTDGLAGRTIDVINSADGTLLAVIAEAGVEDVDRAVAAARRAFPRWATLPAVERGRLLTALTDAIENHAEELARLGKSGHGREMGFAAMDEYTTRKSVWINVDATLPDRYAR